MCCSCTNYLPIYVIWTRENGNVGQIMSHRQPEVQNSTVLLAAHAHIGITHLNHNFRFIGTLLIFKVDTQLHYLFFTRTLGLHLTKEKKIIS